MHGTFAAPPACPQRSAQHPPCGWRSLCSYCQFITNPLRGYYSLLVLFCTWGCGAFWGAEPQWAITPTMGARPRCPPAPRPTVRAAAAPRGAEGHKEGQTPTACVGRRWSTWRGLVTAAVSAMYFCHTLAAECSPLQQRRGAEFASSCTRWKAPCVCFDGRYSKNVIAGNSASTDTKHWWEASASKPH